MASVEGGMEIEQLAVERPEALARIPVDPLDGVDAAKAAEIADAAGFPADVRDQVVDVLVKLWETFTAEDATLVEVNPLVRTPDGRVVALDGKVTLDGNADFRHAETVAAFADPAADDPLEQRAKEKDLNYVKLDGEVGIIGNGAGLVMSTLDVVAYAGERHGGVRPANFLDIGGGADAEVMANGLEIILADPAVRVGVRERLRRHHRLRRGGERDRAGLPAARVPGRGGDAAAGGPAGRQQRRGGPADPHRGRAARGRAGGHDGRRRRARRGAGGGEAATDVDLPDRDPPGSSCRA